MKTHTKIGLCAFALMVMLWSTTIFHTQAARADNDHGGAMPPFTEASLHGTYAGYLAAARGGGAVGAIVLFSFDGAGNISGTTTWNVGGTINSFDILATYTVEPDGSIASSSQQTGATEGDFVGVITRSRKIGRKRVAIEAAFIGDGLGPLDTVLTFLLTRQSEELTDRRDDDDD